MSTKLDEVSRQKRACLEQAAEYTVGLLSMMHTQLTRNDPRQARRSGCRENSCLRSTFSPHQQPPCKFVRFVRHRCGLCRTHTRRFEHLLPAKQLKVVLDT